MTESIQPSLAQGSPAKWGLALCHSFPWAMAVGPFYCLAGKQQLEPELGLRARESPELQQGWTRAAKAKDGCERPGLEIIFCTAHLV